MFIILVVVVLLMVIEASIYETIINHNNEKYVQDLKNKEDMWNARVTKKDERLKESTEYEACLRNELAAQNKKYDEMKEASEELKNTNDKLKDDIIMRNTEISSLKRQIDDMKQKRDKVRELKRIMPKRPKRGNKDQIEQYVKDYLRISGIDYKIKNKTNSLLSVANDTYEIYCGTERYTNKKTKITRNGLKNMIQEIKKSGYRKEK